MKPLYLGIDASTQSLTGIVVDCGASEVLACESVNFEKDLPCYGTSAGVCVSPENPLEVWSYPAMWLDALEMLFAKLSKSVDMKKISAISGSGQQHATVWLNSAEAFSSWDFSKSLSENMRPFFSRDKSPVWMDASTSAECREMTMSAGGYSEVLQKTGSIMTERFSGAQIRKISKTEAKTYAKTKKIHLNSSFICSVLCAADSPVDFCDASGMNLMNIKNFNWDPQMLDSCAQNLESKLPKLASPKTVAGKIAKYFCRKYGFNENAKIVVFTGDNPSSIVGLGASNTGTAAVSLGTSDTFFCSLKDFRPLVNAHIFCNPNGAYMGLICFRNASLARDKFRQMMGVNWKFFDETAFKNYMPTPDKKLILPFFVDEISPRLQSNAPIYAGFPPKDSKENYIRTFIEGQVFNIFLQVKKIGPIPQKIILTGGASKSLGIAQTFADVFGANVYALKSSQNSAALGAAMRAASCDYDLNTLESIFCPLKQIKKARPQATQVYLKKLNLFEDMLRSNIR